LALIEAFAVIALVAFSTYVYVSQPAQPQIITISGAGATFPAPLYQKMGAAYKNLTGVQVNYQGIGSGAGTNQFYNKTVDFAGSDPPLSTTQYTNFTNVGLKPLHIPMAIGGIVVTYNITGVTAKLNFTGYLLAAIFQGNITKWNDANITALNPALASISNNIVICHRSDSSGSTKIFTTFLKNSNPHWVLGAGNTVTWPTNSLGGTGNSGVADKVSHNTYSIGYVELQYALGSSLAYGNVQNVYGYFITPSLSSLSAAASAVPAVFPANGSMSFATVGAPLNLLLNSTNADAAYPITSYTYIIVNQNLGVVHGMTLEKAEALKAFLLWAVNEGQAYAPGLSYVPLPASVRALDDATIGSIYFA
jgi:phosphate transport system substrate-binding protein